jgi:uncharacterized membrane-anchored protein YitT (DUF2179 family)
MTITKSEKIRKLIEDYTIITIGLAIFALSWTLFLIPAEITGGGVSGLAAVVYYSSKIPIGLTYLLLTFFW